MTLTEDELARPLTAEEEAKYFAYWFDPARTSPPSSMDVGGVRRLLATLAALRAPVADTAGIDALDVERLRDAMHRARCDRPPGTSTHKAGNGVRCQNAAEIAAALRTPKPEGESE